MSEHIADAGQMVPLSATLARLRDLRERATSNGEWFSWDVDELWCSDGYGEWVVASDLTVPDRDLIALEHNTGPLRDAMLERAREIIRRFQDDPYWEHTYEGGADDMADDWLAEYEGAGDE